MRSILVVIFLVFISSLSAQVKNTGFPHYEDVPSSPPPFLPFSSEVRYDISRQQLFYWDRNDVSWKSMGVDTMILATRGHVATEIAALDIPSVSVDANVLAKGDGGGGVVNSSIFNVGANVGIGTASPTRPVEIVTNLSGVRPLLRLNSTSSGSLGVGIELDGSANNFNSANHFLIASGGTRGGGALTARGNNVSLGVLRLEGSSENTVGSAMIQYNARRALDGGHTSFAARVDRRGIMYDFLNEGNPVFRIYGAPEGDGWGGSIFYGKLHVGGNQDNDLGAANVYQNPYKLNVMGGAKISGQVVLVGTTTAQRPTIVEGHLGYNSTWGGFDIGTSLGVRRAAYYTDVTPSDGHTLVYDAVAGAFVPTEPKIKLFTPTSSADVTGNIGDITYDDDYIFVKTSAGWKRSTLTSF